MLRWGRWGLILDCATQFRLKGGTKLGRWEHETGEISMGGGNGRDVARGKGEFKKGVLRREWCM